jgi:hypothetical protein
MEGNLMSTIVGETFKYALSDALKNQDIISQHLVDSELNVEVLVVCRNQSEILTELIKLCERIY